MGEPAEMWTKGDGMMVMVWSENMCRVSLTTTVYKDVTRSKVALAAGLHDADIVVSMAVRVTDVKTGLITVWRLSSSTKDVGASSDASLTEFVTARYGVQSLCGNADVTETVSGNCIDEEDSTEILDTPPNTEADGSISNEVHGALTVMGMADSVVICCVS